jgi:hypothetical protein
MRSVDVAADFNPRLANRNERQGDGRSTAIDFRRKYLSELDSAEVWKAQREPIVLDFKGVRKIGPSFANEAFGYFTKYTDPTTFLETVKLVNISRVQLMIIEQELKSGYQGR